MNIYFAVAVAVITAGISYDGYDTHKRLDNLSTRVGELEDRIVLQDESRRQIQRLALEQLQKKRKETKCQTHSKAQSL